MTEPKEAVPGPIKLSFHYVKSNDYREFSCHGVLGGYTPQGNMWITFYAERPAIPRTIEYEVPVDASGGFTFDEASATPANLDTRGGLIRHVEACTYLDLDTAERLHLWLGSQIEELKKIRNNG